MSLSDEQIENIWQQHCQTWELTGKTLISPTVFARAVLAAAAQGQARDIGAKLANVAFNWAQREGYVLTASDCTMLDKLRRAWDEGVTSPPPASELLRQALGWLQSTATALAEEGGHIGTDGEALIAAIRKHLGEP